MKELNSFELNGCRVLPDSDEVIVGEELFKLTPKERDILILLYNHRGQTVSRTQILDTVWGESLGNDSGLSQAISRLRQIFNDDPKNAKLIKTIPKRGYQLVAEPALSATSEEKNATLWLKLERLSSVQKFAIKLAIILLLIVIFLLIFDVNIRVEEL